MWLVTLGEERRRSGGGGEVLKVRREETGWGTKVRIQDRNKGRKAQKKDVCNALDSFPVVKEVLTRQVRGVWVSDSWKGVNLVP